MANGFVFVSPSVKFQENDLTFVTQNVGITTLGLVGETQKGPAFEAIPIADKSEFLTRFGSQSTEKIGDNLKYMLPYVANSYLAESNQLFVTRILGLSGYDAVNGWAIVLSAGLDNTTTGSTGTNNFTGQSFTNSTYQGVTISQTGVTYTSDVVFAKSSATAFTGESYTFSATTYNAVAGTGLTSGYITSYSGTSLLEYENMVLAIIRSRASYVTSAGTEVLQSDASSVSIDDSADSDLLGQFTLTVNSIKEHKVSLNNNSRDYLPNVIGSTAKDKTSTNIFVEAIYPQLIKKLDAEEWGYGVKASLV